MSDIARAYLLGKLTDSEVELFEARLLADADCFAEVETAEDDLFDAFARGSLDSGDRARFLQRFGRDPVRRHFADALARKGIARPAPLPLWHRDWFGFAAAAAVALVVGGVVSQQQPSVRSSAGEVAVPPTTSPALVTLANPVFTISPATSRASRGPERVAIPAAAAAIDLRIRLNAADRFSVYAVDVRSASDAIVWGDSALRASAENGDLIVHAVIPASRLTSGTYDVAIRGGDSAAKLEDLGFSQIEVRREQ